MANNAALKKKKNSPIIFKENDCRLENTKSITLQSNVMKIGKDKNSIFKNAVLIVSFCIETESSPKCF